MAGNARCRGRVLSLGVQPVGRALGLGRGLVGLAHPLIGEAVLLVLGGGHHPAVVLAVVGAGVPRVPDPQGHPQDQGGGQDSSHDPAPTGGQGRPDEASPGRQPGPPQRVFGSFLPGAHDRVCRLRGRVVLWLLRLLLAVSFGWGSKGFSSVSRNRMMACKK